MFAEGSDPWKSYVVASNYPALRANTEYCLPEANVFLPFFHEFFAQHTRTRLCTLCNRETSCDSHVCVNLKYDFDVSGTRML